MIQKLTTGLVVIFRFIQGRTSSDKKKKKCF